MVLQGIAEHDATAREALKRYIFAPKFLEAELDPKDPYRPAGEPAGFDPNLDLPDEAPLRMWLIKALTSSNYNLKRVVGDMLYAVSGDDSEEFVRLTGLGSAAGLLQERDMFAAFQHMVTKAEDVQ